MIVGLVAIFTTGEFQSPFQSQVNAVEVEKGKCAANIGRLFSLYLYRCDSSHGSHEWVGILSKHKKDYVDNLPRSAVQSHLAHHIRVQIGPTIHARNYWTVISLKSWVIYTCSMFIRWLCKTVWHLRFWNIDLKHKQRKLHVLPDLMMSNRIERLPFAPLIQITHVFG